MCKLDLEYTLFLLATKFNAVLRMKLHLLVRLEVFVTNPGAPLRAQICDEVLSVLHSCDVCMMERDLQNVCDSTINTRVRVAETWQNMFDSASNAGIGTVNFT